MAHPDCAGYLSRVHPKSLKATHQGSDALSPTSEMGKLRQASFEAPTMMGRGPSFSAAASPTLGSLTPASKEGQGETRVGGSAGWGYSTNCSFASATKFWDRKGGEWGASRIDRESPPRHPKSESEEHDSNHPTLPSVCAAVRGLLGCSQAG